MTIVAALMTPEGAWMGSDSLSSDDATCATVSSPKVGKFGDKLVGFAGSWEGLRVLDVARRNPGISAEELVFRSGPFKDDGLVLLIIEGRHLYFVQSEKTLVRRTRSRGYAYDAIGGGGPLALGSLYAKHEGREDLLTSLKCAAHHNPHCQGPFRIVSL